ncbi:AbrB/MazE/SpoVT family DNA-binding domain-containing protein [Candidatus Woesearchaeota archaeon]|nr:AbrB/MazE/SpoVT family DNA-binding domain-containing protein [Candidatus Woesearchaeota archaeon]
MVRIESRVGPKGQVVIPKIFRDEYNISPGDKIIFEENSQSLVLKKPNENIVKVFEEIAKKVRFKGKIDVHAIEEQYEERWKRAQHI